MSEIQYGLYVGGEFEQYVKGEFAAEEIARAIAFDYSHDCPQIDMRNMDTGEILTVFYQGGE